MEIDLKKPAVFILVIRDPLAVLPKICDLFREKEVKLELLQLIALGETETRLSVQCLVEPDRTAYIGQLMEKLAGVVSVEWLNMRARGKRF